MLKKGLSILLSLSIPALAGNYIVNNSYPSGPGSLHQALLHANAEGGTSTIEFDIERDQIVFIDSSNPLPIIACDLTIIGGESGNIIDAREDEYDSSPLNRIFETDSESRTVELRNLVLQHCGTSSSTASAVYIPNGYLSMNRCWVHNCQTAESGAALYLEAGRADIASSTFSNNSALREGGAVYVKEGFIDLAQVTLSTNLARDGGAIYISNDGSGSATSCTLYDNTATITGGGIANFGYCSVSNSILYNTSTPLLTINRESYDAYNILYYAYGGNQPVFRDVNLVKYLPQDYSVTENLISGDPLLGPLAFNGGLVPTHAPSCHSPVLDRAMGYFYADARGYSANINLLNQTSNSHGSITDLGAVELPFSQYEDISRGKHVYDLNHSDGGIYLQDELMPHLPDGIIEQKMGDYWTPVVYFDLSSNQPGRYEFRYTDSYRREYYIQADPSQQPDPLETCVYFSIELADHLLLTVSGGTHDFFSLEQMISDIQRYPETNTIILEASDPSTSEITIPFLAPIWVQDTIRIKAEEGLKVTFTGISGIHQFTNSAFEISSDGYLELEGISFKGYSSAPYGYSNQGGVIRNHGSLNLRQCNFTNNHYTGQLGGAIYTQGNTWIEDTSFDQNSSQDGGAIYNRNSALLHIARSTFSNNNATWDGGAIRNAFSNRCEIFNSTFSANTAENGSAISNWNSFNMSVFFSTFAYNKADYHTTIYDDQDGITSLGSLFAGSDNLSYSTYIDTQFNFIEDEYNQAHLAPLKHNGGYVKTHALRRQSEAIDTLYFNDFDFFFDHSLYSYRHIDARGKKRRNMAEYPTEHVGDFGAYYSRSSDFPAEQIKMRLNTEGRPVLQFQAEYDASYTVEYSYDMINWVVIEQGLHNDGSTEWTDSSTHPEKSADDPIYYRIRTEEEL